MAAMQKITPNFWCDHNAREMADFYVSVFPGSEITGGSKYPASQDEGLADFQLDLAGKDLTIELTLAVHQFVLINAGPEFKATPANSHFVNFDPSHDEQAREHLDEVWEKLADGGTILMPLDEYPFSKHYGWVQDKYGYSWQLILTNPEGEERPCIVPSLLFNDDKANKAEEAMNYYVSVFQNSRVETVAKYDEDQPPVKAGGIMYADFCLDGSWFTAMDAPGEHGFTFNEAVSYSVICKDQAEIDHFWDKLSAVPESEQCGWCKDKYGVSWQIVPENMEELMSKPDAFKTMMNQHKIVIAEY